MARFFVVLPLILLVAAGCVESRVEPSNHATNVCALPCAKLRAIGCGAEQGDQGASFEASCLVNCPEDYDRGIFTDTILQCLVDLPAGSDCTNVSDCAPAL